MSASTGTIKADRLDGWIFLLKETKQEGITMNSEMITDCKALCQVTAGFTYNGSAVRTEWQSFLNKEEKHLIL